MFDMFPFSAILLTAHDKVWLAVHQVHNVGNGHEPNSPKMCAFIACEYGATPPAPLQLIMISADDYNQQLKQRLSRESGIKHVLEGGRPRTSDDG